MSKRKHLKIESHRGGEWYNFVFQNFLKSKKSHHYSTFTDKCPSITERVIRSVRNLLKKPVFQKGNADWLSELPSVIKKDNNVIHHRIKMTPLEASLKKNEILVYSNLKNNREVRKTKFRLGQFVRTADIKRIKRVSVMMIQQNFHIGHTRQLKSYTILFLALELTIYPRDIMKIH